MIADYLISEGVEYVFAVPGHGNTALLDAFVDAHERWSPTFRILNARPAASTSTPDPPEAMP